MLEFVNILANLVEFRVQRDHFLFGQAVSIIPFTTFSGNLGTMFFQ